MTIKVLWLVVALLAPSIEGGERNIQHFVKIDVAKINVKNTTDPNGNVSSTTPMSESVTETSTKASETTTTSTASTTTATSATTSKATTTEPAATTESTTTGSSTTTPSLDSPDGSYPLLKTGRAAKLVPTGYYCRCDLTINVCDINCCCDIDCNAAILRTYDCDQEELHTDEYHHDEGLQSCRVQGGLFCLVEPIYEEGDDSYYNPGSLPAATRHKWKEVFPLDSSASTEDIRFDHYRVDDVLYVYNETSELVQLFALPISLTSTVCHIEQPVRFLRDHISLCRRTVEELGDFNRLFLRHVTSSVRFFRTPKKSTVMEHYCVEDGDCLNATVSVCNYTPGDGWNCTMRSNVTDTTNFSGEEMYEDDAGTVCRELEVQFYHNYTNLQRVHVKLLCRPYPDRSSDGELWMEVVWQRITVKFIVTTVPSSKANSTRAVSGNIGYLAGKPIIVTHQELPANGTLPPGETTPENASNRMLAYFTNGTRLPDATFRLRIPISRRNRCVLNENVHQTIDFGTDLFHRCNYIPPDLSNQTSGSVQNYTKFCQDLQAGLYAQLLHGIYPDTSSSGVKSYDKLNLYLSKYGNPNNRTSDWVRVRSTNVILDAEPGSEAPSSTDTTESFFTCSNMLINVEYRFFYARTRVRDVRHQAIVHDAEIVFGPRVNLRFRLDEEVRVPIFIQVQFYDLTSSSVAVVGFSWYSVSLGVVFIFLIERSTSMEYI